MNKLIRLMQASEDFASLTPATDNQIADAESKLHLRFANDFKEYLHSFGAAAVCGKEMTGICSSERLDVVSVTERARRYFSQFPADAYVVEELLIDHIITIQKADGIVYSYGPNDTEEKLAGSLCEYLFPQESAL